MKVPGRVYAKISLEAIDHNVAVMKRLVGPETRLCAVVKTNAYGHGAGVIAPHLESDPQIWGFAVATVEEGVDLRDHGITKPILVLGYVFPDDYETLVRAQIRPAVFTVEMARELSDAAGRLGAALPVHIAVDTGMSRIGVPDDERGLDTVSQIAALPGLSIEGMFTHFARADEADKSAAQSAMDRYLAFRDALRARGIIPSICHIANSAAILELPSARLDMARMGITLYGIYPSGQMRRDKDLRPVMELKSHVSYVKEIPAGVSVSYGGTWTSTDRTALATVPVGYGDGYPRSLSNRGYVLIHGQKAPIRGRVCMDQFMVDVTGISGVRAGDEVTLMGADGDAFLSVEELAALSGRFEYEFVCGVSARVPRIFCPAASSQTA